MVKATFLRDHTDTEQKIVQGFLARWIDDLDANFKQYMKDRGVEVDESIYRIEIDTRDTVPTQKVDDLRDFYALTETWANMSKTFFDTYASLQAKK